ncbi:GntR family transcriptional regulator [Oribacterium sp. P6A1]|uniref:GntR family transcriptional regulator n=1 Tax=Oribacterium sp. P6A1 TaxID=1410612 RepID=UPI0005679565|nr:GntR family transcriptional regulator [Oribacterium sp. P6A1]
MAKEIHKHINESLKYQKLYKWGRTLIMSGVLKDGDKFMSEHVLEKKFGYSRQTVRAALEKMEQEGLIKRVRGSGTYVSYETLTGDDGDNKPHIGLILSYFADYLFPEVYAGIESVMKEQGFQIDVAITRNRLNEETMYLENFLKAGVSGLIIEGTRTSFPNPNLRLYKEIRRKNIPTIFIHNHYSNISFDSVEMSDSKSSYELTKYLAANGHRKIGAMMKSDDMQGMERYRGFTECLSDFGLRFDDDWVRWYTTKDMEEKFSKKSLMEFYRRTKECTALIMYNDEIAYRYMDFLTERGVKVPEDISLVSFDDAKMQETGEINILSVVHPKFELGKMAANNLLRMMNDRDWTHHNYAYRFPVAFNSGNSVKDIR